MSDKYLLVEGFVTSKNDGDRHFISAEQLRRIYRIRKQDCDVVRYNEPHFMKEEKYSRNYKKILYPRYDGVYELWYFYQMNLKRNFSKHLI